MKRFLAAAAALCLALPALAQDRPGAVFTDAAETVVMVRAVDYQNRTVTVETAAGKLVTINVPPESQNLDQVYAGSKFRVAYLQSVALFIGAPGTPAAASASAVQMAEKGATPGGVIVEVKEAQARIDMINYETRTVLLTGPEGNQFEVVADDSVKRLDEIKAGDMVVVRYTEALAMRMIRQ